VSILYVSAVACVWWICDVRHDGSALFILSPIVRDSDRPWYLQIADQIRSAIEEGRLAPRGKLPSEAEMCESAGVTRGTVRAALFVLKAEKFIVSEKGKGWFVRGA
jgi:DNA-binding GntR family transcriptional regulator